ncbi:Bax inhibitor-1/YccA family protein [Motiliproteus sediminis]|uniref:Bax inhibitor-1/YccA family protein n=1 Tax=Motiliproteus sediminis TaxID=1468178 RepID=UPI001AF02572|nr:Bax inhibitor-1/YccA family protein [Motiliproteus sediminis]
MNTPEVAVSRTQSAAYSTNKVIRNTYLLLAMTLVFSAVTAGVSMALQPGPLVYFGSVIASFVMIFVINRMQNSIWALPLTFLFTGLMGFGLGPLLNHYLAMPNGGEVIMTAMSMTALTFLGLSAYVLTSRKDFSFMGGFLTAGLIVVVVAVLANLVLSMFGVHISGLQLAISAAAVLLFSGFILYDTSNIVNGTYTNYVMATVSLYLNIYNLLVHLLHLVGVMNDD